MIAGCEEENLLAIRKSRIIAIENKQLKEQLEQLDKEIKKQKELLTNCLQEKKALEEKPLKDSKARMEHLLKAVVGRNKQLNAKNKNLKTQISLLESQIEQLKKELEELRKPTARQQDSQNHTDWIDECMRRIQSIQPGATRAELLKVFTTEGGISNRLWRRYVYKECPYIKVDVEFRALDDDRHEKTDDVITKISKPFLEWSIMD